MTGTVVPVRLKHYSKLTKNFINHVIYGMKDWNNIFTKWSVNLPSTKPFKLYEIQGI